MMENLFNDIPKIDLPLIRRGYVAQIPDTGWKNITSYPTHYVNAARIAYDVETRDPELMLTGAGWGKGLGYIVGISLAAQFHDGHVESCYLPIRHDICREYNLDEAQTIAFVKYVMETPHIPKVGANLLYDYGWLTEYGIYPQGLQLDVQFAEALMSNDGHVALELLGQKYCGIGKTVDMLYTWIKQTFPKTSDAKVRQHIWQAPPQLVGHYAEQDAILPLQVLEKQWPILAENGLIDVFMMESELIPLLVKMRREGVTVDLQGAYDLRTQLMGEIQTESQALYQSVGREFNINSSPDIGLVCDALNLKYRRTDAGAPSFKKDWMKAQSHPLFLAINELREKEKIVSTFLEGHVLGNAVNSKIHCAFHPLRSDSGGTRTGRFSSSNPNLQNIPARTDLGAKIRELFIPDAGHETMFCGDYSQIEYRTLAHFAVGRGADDVRNRYIVDPTTDYHDMTIALVKEMVGLDVPRKYIKNINFGLLYGMSIGKLAAQLGLTMIEAKPIFQAYHSAAPYVKATMALAAEEAAELGYVRTIVGRKGYFDAYVPCDGGYDVTPLPYEQALRQWGAMIERDKLYKAINYKIQGSAADGMKMAMLQGWKSGIFDEIGVPRLTVHDELLFSIPERTPRMDEALKEFVNIAETCLPFSVPLLFDAGYGKTWGEAK